MISYEPLYKTLMKKKLNFLKLGNILGYNNNPFGHNITTGKYIKTETLLKICEVLQCDISDVIEWKEGEQTLIDTNDSYSPDMEKFKAAILDKGSFRNVSLAIGKNENYLQQLVKKESFKKRIFENVCDSLGFDYKEFL